MWRSVDSSSGVGGSSNAAGVREAVAGRQRRWRCRSNGPRTIIGGRRKWHASRCCWSISVVGVARCSQNNNAKPSQRRRIRTSRIFFWHAMMLAMDECVSALSRTRHRSSLQTTLDCSRLYIHYFYPHKNKNKERETRNSFVLLSSIFNFILSSIFNFFFIFTFLLEPHCELHFQVNFLTRFSTLFPTTFSNASFNCIFHFIYYLFSTPFSRIYDTCLQYTYA